MAIRLSWRRSWPLLLLSCAGIPRAIAADPADFTYRTKATEVRLSFSATDQNNHGVATLQASDFAVVDKDVIVRNFQSFTRSDGTKLEIAILFDTSGSVAAHLRQEMAAMVELVSEAAGVPDENLSIVSFDGPKPALLCAGDCRASHAVDRIPATGAKGLTPLFDTIVFTADFLSRRSDAQSARVLIVLSDGVDTISRSSLDDAIEGAMRGDVQLHCIDLNKPSNESSQGAAVLRNLSSATGGRYFASPDGGRQAMNAILEGFKATYMITYRLPSHAFGFHVVRILPTHNLNLHFRSRSGYYYPTQVR